jgi:cytochrome c biogenesis protein CcdA
LAFSFALAGTGVSFALVQLGLDPELFRYVAGAGLVVVAAVLLLERLADVVSVLGTRVTGRLRGVSGDASSAWGALGVGGLSGLVWLPCVGPTLGAAIALASVGQDFLLAFATMAAYGAGTGAVLLLVSDTLMPFTPRAGTL